MHLVGNKVKSCFDTDINFFSVQYNNSCGFLKSLSSVTHFNHSPEYNLHGTHKISSAELALPDIVLYKTASVAVSTRHKALNIKFLYNTGSPMTLSTSTRLPNSLSKFKAKQ